MNLKKLLVSSIVGAVSWTVALTPYVIWITKMTWSQYYSWLGMQFILVPIIAPGVFWVTEKALKRLKFED